MSSKSKALGFKLARPVVAAIYCVGRGFKVIGQAIVADVKFIKNEASDFTTGVRQAIHNRGDKIRID